MGGLSPEKQRELDRMADDDLQFRQIIAAHLMRVTEDKSYELRRRFVEVVGQSRWKSGRRGVIYLSTNWDHLLEKAMALSSKSIVHLHGDVSRPACIYLPSETSHEAHRSPESNKYIATLTGTAWQVIRDTRQLCIYGLSLSPLDAELSWVLQAGLDAHTRETLRIHLFNRGEELDKVEWRVRLLLPSGSNIEIEKHAVD